MPYTILLLVLLLVLPGRVAEAQNGVGASAVQLRAAAGLRHLGERTMADEHQRAALASEPARDYRWEGLAIGAGVLGVVGALAMHSTCEENEACTGPTIGGFALGALVGGVSGGLIGSLISKGEQ